MNQNSALMLPLIGVLIAYVAFIFFRQRKQNQSMSERKNALVPGTEVMLSSGIYGVMTGKDDENIFVEIAPGVITKWNALAVAKIITSHSDIPDSAQEDLVSDEDQIPDTALVSEKISDQIIDSKEVS